MSRISREELRRRRRSAFVEEAGRAFDRMLGDDGQDGLVTFDEREERACDLGDALTRRLLADHLAADDAADPGVAVACPHCGTAARCERAARVERETREVRTRRGSVTLTRAARRCSRCRRVFFPAG
jgi:hypothetical protein